MEKQMTFRRDQWVLRGIAGDTIVHDEVYLGAVQASSLRW